MSSDEEFSLVMEPALPLSEESLEGIQASIHNYKKICDKLSEEQTELAAITKDTQEMTQKCQLRSVKLALSLEEEQRSHKERVEQEREKLVLMSLEVTELMEEIRKVEDAVKEEEAKNEHLRQQADVFATVPEKKVVFAGEKEKCVEMGNASTDAQKFEMNSRVVYPMDGGTALITFEEEAAARRILTTKTHRVPLEGDCHVTVEARPVQLLLPRRVEIDSEICPRRILITDLPDMDLDTLLNKLNIHFHRRKHGGGEVEDCFFQPDSGTVVLMFVENNVAVGLTETEFHQVQLPNKKHTVRVTPFLKGEITNLETAWAACPRTVLLTGIPAVMEQETLQDLLEIHFQKHINGGGEIEAVLYNPSGQRAAALFESVGRPEEDGQ